MKAKFEEHIQASTRQDKAVNGTIVTSTNLAAAAYLSALSFLFGNVQPVVLGAISEHHSIGIIKVGFLASLFMLVSGSVKVTAPVWIRRSNMRVLSTVSVIAAAFAFVFASLASSYILLMLGIAAFAIAEGIYGTTSYTVLGDYSDPSRAYAIAIVTQMSLAATFILIATSVLEPYFGYSGIMLGFAFLIASGFLFHRLFPKTTLTVLPLPKDNDETVTEAISFKYLLPFTLTLSATIIFLAAIMALWVFSERYAASFGLELQFVGTSIAVASIVTALAALLSASLSKRVSPILMATAGVSIVIVGVSMLIQKTAFSYLLGMSLLSFGWGLAQPFYYGVVRLTDPTGKLFTGVPAMINVGMASGIAVGGYIAESFGFTDMMIVAVATLTCSVLMLTVGLRIMKKPSYHEVPDNA